MFFLRNRIQIRRHQFLSLTCTSIVSYLYYNLFFRNIHTHALSSTKYSRIVAIFDYNSNNQNFKNLFPNKNYLYISKLYSSTPSYTSKNIVCNSFSPEISYDTVFRHSILNMEEPNSVEEPTWVKESKDFDHQSFDKLGSLYLPGLGVVATNYKHKLSGLSVMSLQTHPDSGKEMCFDLCVPTPPLNSKGSPHVLEHSVLAGTPKYQSSDSFSLIVQGCFTSFLNATTYKDRTSYLFASTNEKAFYQIADFYMDSFFRPNILHNKVIFDQECWHYNVSDGNSDKTDADIFLHGRKIGFSGIVYSEMRKRSSDSSALFYYFTNQNLFNNSYQYVSGGDPKDIVDLTHQELVNFYKLYYGPKTATLYLYGPYSVKNRLDFVDNYLNTYSIGMNKDPKSVYFPHDANLSSADSHLQLEEYKDKPTEASYQFGSSDPNDDEIMISWILDPAVKGSLDRFKIDFVDNVGFQVLNYLLIGTPESVLYKALIDSGFGKKVIGSGFYSGYLQSLFSVGLKGVDKRKHESKEELIKSFEKIVFDTLNKIKQEGFKRDAIDSGMNTVEFEMRELNTGYLPKGLALINLMQTQLQYGRDPFGLMRFDYLMSELRKRVFCDNPSLYFVNLLKKHMLDNTTRVTLHLEAVESAKFEKEMNQKIASKLTDRLSHLTKEEVDNLEKEYKEFKKHVEKTEDENVMNNFSTIELSDIGREQEKIPSKFYKLSDDKLEESKSLYNDGHTLTVVTHPLESHGILYMEYALSLDNLSVDDLKYLGLFASMLKESGTDKLSSEELSYKVDKNLGGLSFSTYFTTETNNRTYDDPNKGLGYLVVRSKSLKNKVDDMVDVVNDVLLNTDFSNSKKGLELLKRSLSQFKTNIVSDGHEFASRRMSSRFSVDRYAEEVVNGYSQYLFLRDTLLPLAEKDWSKVESKLNDLRNKLLNKKYLTVNLTGDEELLDGFLNNSKLFYKKLNSTFKSNVENVDRLWVKEVLDKKLLDSTDKNELLVVPTKVNYVGQGGRLFDQNDELDGSDKLVFHYIRFYYLFKYLRMSLGAYGSYTYLLNTGHVIFVSYADPNFDKTLDVYNKTPSALKEAYESLNDRDLLRQKIGKLSDLDKPLHVEDKSIVSFKRILRNESDEIRQKFREDIMDSTVKCFEKLSEKFETGKNWNQVCAVVDNTTSNEASSEYKRLYMN